MLDVLNSLIELEMLPVFVAELVSADNRRPKQERVKMADDAINCIDETELSEEDKTYYKNRLIEIVKLLNKEIKEDEQQDV